MYNLTNIHASLMDGVTSSCQIAAAANVIPVAPDILGWPLGYSPAEMIQGFFSLVISQRLLPLLSKASTSTNYSSPWTQKRKRQIN